ncbi:hypothetical protein HGRIS_014093 [Hohenbuehelia grisea]|uniref:Carboxymuconolactone decarboxylase-like domain-containing protein n=1 Tax=Hohenbuehelia grisea TaxID=104357 RepID=A0ABR3JSK3_9AGAR
MSSSRWGVWPLPRTGYVAHRRPYPQTTRRSRAYITRWNSFGALPGDVREIMILRVAARNKAAFEWIHHEPVARQSGVTTQQLQVVRDVDGELHPPLKEDLLTPLQSAALAYADASTTQVKVDAATTQRLLAALENSDTVRLSKEAGTDTTEEFLVEAAAVVATYNMVSRFLVSLDVAGMSDEPVPWPYDRKEIDVPLPAPSPSSGSAQTLRVVTYITSADAPWIILSIPSQVDHILNSADGLSTPEHGHERLREHRRYSRDTSSIVRKRELRRLQSSDIKSPTPVSRHAPKKGLLLI